MTAAVVRDDASRRAAASRRGSSQDVEHDASPRRVDALVHVARPRTTDPHRVIGAKPATFARWMFDLLGASTVDTLDDLYPGSRGVSRAWSTFCEGAE